MIPSTRTRGRSLRAGLASIVCAVALASLAAACSGNTATTPTTPTTPAVTAAISPVTTNLQIGQTQTFTLTASTSPTSVTWTSSNTNVMTIDEGGNATAVGVGAATIAAIGDASQSATLVVQVVPIYQGNWAGTATVIACTDLAGFTAGNYCAQNLGVARRVTLSLTQSGLSVAGAMTKSEGANLLNGSVGGSIGASGEISVAGTLAGLANGSNLQLTVISWNSMADGSQMTGTWAGNVTSPQILGLATLQWSLTMQPSP